MISLKNVFTFFLTAFQLRMSRDTPNHNINTSFYFKPTKINAQGLALRCTSVRILPMTLRALMVCLNTLTVGMVEKREGTLAFAKTFCFAAA